MTTPLAQAHNIISEAVTAKFGEDEASTRYGIATDVAIEFISEIYTADDKDDLGQDVTDDLQTLIVGALLLSEKLTERLGDMLQVFAIQHADSPA